jgi:hypothetical protein
MKAADRTGSESTACGEKAEASATGGERVACITLKYGDDDPLLVEPREGALVAHCRGPEGVGAAAAERVVAAVLAAPTEGPPLERHVVPGDRVVLAVDASVPQADAVVAAVVQAVTAAGVQPADVSLLRSPPLDVVTAGAGAVEATGAVAGIGGVAEFDPAAEPQTSYIAADASGRPIHVARALVDADVVIAVGGWGWDAALGGRGIGGELWPAFSRRSCRQDLLRTLAVRGRRGLPGWKASCHEATWQLGLCASLRVVGGRGDSLLAAAFGMPDVAADQARGLAVGWSPQVARTAALSIATLSASRGTPAMLLRAVAAAARVTHPSGTICVASGLAELPGLIFSRWREGAPLAGLVREAVGTGDETLVADAFLTRFFARALGDRRLVLLSAADEAAVEDLEFGHAAAPEVVERLAHRAESVVVLEEADRILPRLA